MDGWLDRLECVPERVIVRESRMEWTQRMERERLEKRREGESMGGGEGGGGVIRDWRQVLSQFK